MNHDQPTTQITRPKHLNEDSESRTLVIEHDGVQQRITMSLSGGDWLTLWAEPVTTLNAPRVQVWIPRAAVGALWEAIADLDASIPDPNADQPYGGDDD
jgi:hypothetical protein